MFSISFCPWSMIIANVMALIVRLHCRLPHCQFHFSKSVLSVKVVPIYTLHKKILGSRLLLIQL